MTAATEVSSDQKNLADFVKFTHVCDIIKSGIKTDNDRRNEQRYLLLSITYGLNSSHTKKIHVGLQVTNEDCFVPIVKLTGNNADRICFDTDTWQQFQISMEHMMLCLSENQKTKPSPIIINNISIDFTTAYGIRAVIVTYKENTEQSPSVRNRTNKSHNQP